MKYLLLLFACVILLNVSYAQDNRRTCLSHDKYLKSMSNPKIAAKRNAFLKRMEKIEQNQQFKMSNPQNSPMQGIEQNGNVNNFEVNGNVYIIPTVFHIVHNGDAIGSNENISNAKVLDQLQQLNDDFRRLNSDASNTPAAFLPVASDTEIEFCLASVDPNGNTTTGILRHQVSQGSFNPNQNTLANVVQQPNAWPPGQYLNIWVCNLTNGILGYAYLPGTAPNLHEDGVVILYSSVGSLTNPFAGAAPVNMGRTLTHEVGHWLNLEHIWGDGPCGADDSVADTPSSDDANYGCPTNHVSCGTTDMVQNYMDYTDDGCMNIFTNGQKTRMRNAITASRASLLTSPCGATVNCNPGTVNISNSSPLDLCTASTFTLNASAAGSGFTHQWTLNGNDISGANNATYAASAAGNYGVYLTDGNGCESTASNSIILNACNNTGGNCTPILTLNGSSTVTGTYEAQISTSSYTSNQNNSSINFYAGDYIELGNGFQTPTSTDFLAKIQTCTPVAAGPLIDEDFTNCSMPTGWMTYGIAGTGSAGASSVFFNATGTTGGYSTIPATFSGCAALIDDDDAGYGDNQTTCIETNAINIANAANGTLSFSWAFEEYYYGSEGLVEVYDGSSWVTLMTIATNSSSEQDLAGSVSGSDCGGTLSSTGPIGDPDILDISCYSNADFKIRFCYDDLSDWGWGFAIDNVLVE